MVCKLATNLNINDVRNFWACFRNLHHHRHDDKSPICQKFSLLSEFWKYLKTILKVEKVTIIYLCYKLPKSVLFSSSSHRQLSRNLRDVRTANETTALACELFCIILNKTIYTVNFKKLISLCV